MLNKMLYQVTAQCSSRISFLFHFISSHSILFSFFLQFFFFDWGFFFGRFPFALHRNAHSFTYVTFYYISFIFVSLALLMKLLSPVLHRWAWSCSCPCSLVFIISFVCAPLNSVCLCVSFVSLWTVSGPNFKYNPGSLTYPIRFVMYSCLPFG